MTNASSTSPLLAMRAAILGHLASDATLARLMGGSVRLHDEPPRGASPVYALFGDAEIRDESVDGATRHAHSLALTVVARAGSASSAVEAAARMGEVLGDAAPADAALASFGQALVFLRVTALATARDPRSGEASATLSLQAVTETVPAA